MGVPSWSVLQNILLPPAFLIVSSFKCLVSVLQRQLPSLCPGPVEGDFVIVRGAPAGRGHGGRSVTNPVALD